MFFTKQLLSWDRVQFASWSNTGSTLHPCSQMHSIDNTQSINSCILRFLHNKNDTTNYTALGLYNAGAIVLIALSQSRWFEMSCTRNSSLHSLQSKVVPRHLFTCNNAFSFRKARWHFVQIQYMFSYSSVRSSPLGLVGTEECRHISQPQ